MPDPPIKRGSSRQKESVPRNPSQGAASSHSIEPLTQLACQPGQIAAGDTCFLPCRHCRQRRPRGRGRGLCSVCFDNPRIRKRYPWLRREWGEAWEYDQAPRPAPWRPTKHLPGSDEKIATMVARRAKGQLLHHSEDADSTPANPDQFLLEIVYATVKGVMAVQKGNGRVRWRARVQRDGRHKHVGYFDTRAEACLAVLRFRAAATPSRTARD